MTKHYIESDIRNNYRALTKCLIEKHLSITTMESATSGQIASLITAPPTLPAGSRPTGQTASRTYLRAGGTRPVLTR